MYSYTVYSYSVVIYCIIHRLGYEGMSVKKLRTLIFWQEARLRLSSNFRWLPSNLMVTFLMVTQLQSYPRVVDPLHVSLKFQVNKCDLSNRVTTVNVTWFAVIFIPFVIWMVSIYALRPQTIVCFVWDIVLRLVSKLLAYSLFRSIVSKRVYCQRWAWPWLSSLFLLF